MKEAKTYYLKKYGKASFNIHGPPLVKNKLFEMRPI
jgi:hypothetical protein